MNIGIIIQARMESTRLPGKVYKKILGKSILEHVITRTKGSKSVNNIVVAIPDTKKNSILLPIIKKNKVNEYLGSQDNVLLRYIEAAEKFQIDPVIRITADCPLIDPELIDKNIEKYLEFEKKPDYFLVEGYPRGLGDIEILTLEALKKSIQMNKDPFNLEHVVAFIAENPNVFDLKIEKADPKFDKPDFRLCVDEKNDFILVKKIFENFKSKDKFGLEEIIDYLDKNPDLVDINKNVRQKP